MQKIILILTWYFYTASEGGNKKIHWKKEGNTFLSAYLNSGNEKKIHCKKDLIPKSGC